MGKTRLFRATEAVFTKARTVCTASMARFMKDPDLAHMATATLARPPPDP